LKDYDHYIIWLDYFNRSLSRHKGRKLKRESSVFDPTLQDLIDAARSIGYDPPQEDTNDHARYPRRPFVRSGYVMLPKKENKSALIRAIAEKLVQRKNKSRSSNR
jgi:signal recognition particle subunit SRP19